MERSWEGGRKSSRKRKGWIEGDDKHVQDKGAILEEILNEGAVIGAHNSKSATVGVRGALGPGWLEKG